MESKEYIFPENNWYIEITDDNREIVNNWKIKQKYNNNNLFDNLNYKFVNFNGVGWAERWSCGAVWVGRRRVFWEAVVEITIEQFKQYVLKEIPIIEPIIKEDLTYLIELLTKLNIK